MNAYCVLHTLFLLWMLLSAVLAECAEHLVYSFTNHVGAGNFSYFKLHKEGYVVLQLTTITGDADLYVSSVTMSPDYLSYELKSATCGIDQVEIPVEMSRPVAIGVYGHPGHDESEFVLSVYTDELSSQTSAQSTSSQSENEESILWTIFVGILKIILDILV